jgi:hypothetical protein
MFNYEAAGKIRTFGSAIISTVQYFEVYFGVGSVAYIKKQAEKGILEKILIKKIYKNMPKIYSGVLPIISYVDNTNRVWIEDELIDEDDALDSYHVYWTRIKNMGEEIIQYPNS